MKRAGFRRPLSDPNRVASRACDGARSKLCGTDIRNSSTAPCCVPRHVRARRSYRRTRTRCRRPPSRPPVKQVMKSLLMCRPPRLRFRPDLEPFALGVLDHAIAQELHVRFARVEADARLPGTADIWLRCTRQCRARCCCCTCPGRHHLPPPPPPPPPGDGAGPGAGGRSRAGGAGVLKVCVADQLLMSVPSAVCHRTHAPVVGPAVEKRVALIDARLRPRFGLR